MKLSNEQRQALDEVRRRLLGMAETTRAVNELISTAALPVPALSVVGLGRCWSELENVEFADGLARSREAAGVATAAAPADDVDRVPAFLRTQAA